MSNDKTTEEMIIAKGLTAPRVTKELIESKITSVEYVEHKTKSGSILRWCCIEMENGFTVTGKPSASVSAENDDEEIGKKIAYENAYSEIWAYEGYLLATKLTDTHLCTSCKYDFANCEAKDIGYGNGVGNDNVVSCSTYSPK